MGKPEQSEDFVELSLCEGRQPYGTLYIARDVWESIDPKANELIFYVHEYGRFRLKVEQNEG